MGRFMRPPAAYSYGLEDMGSTSAVSELILVATMPRETLRPTQPNQWMPGTLPGVDQLAVKLSTHFHLVLTFRIRGAIPLLPNTS